MNTNQNHLDLFTGPRVRLAANPDQDTFPDIAATAAQIACRLASMEAETFTHAHRDHRVRGACRLLGMLAALALAFVQSLDGLVSWHVGRYMTIPIPLVAGWLAGEIAVLLRREWRARQPRIPAARVISTRRQARA
jgi:hypothetical protein